MKLNDKMSKEERDALKTFLVANGMSKAEANAMVKDSKRGELVSALIERGRNAKKKGRDK